jgi:hypothetical protein
VQEADSGASGRLEGTELGAAVAARADVDDEGLGGDRQAGAPVGVRLDVAGHEHARAVRGEDARGVLGDRSGSRVAHGDGQPALRREAQDEVPRPGRDRARRDVGPAVLRVARDEVVRPAHRQTVLEPAVLPGGEVARPGPGAPRPEVAEHGLGHGVALGGED